jgi:hypothetical protein
MSGASSMDSTSAASTTCRVAAGSRGRSRMWAISTKPNSPPAHSHRPLRMAVPGAAPKARDRPGDEDELAGQQQGEQAGHPGQLRAMTPTSRNMPTVMKNRPSSTSRKGLMSSSTW